MSLTVGTRLGHYDVTALIGEGGMGQVYQATDTKLDRDVALKVLPPDAFTQDPDRLARFEREAKVLASLNHPNIGHIYGLEEADSVRALVLELVEGPTLADRIKGGPIPLDEALPIAKQIAEALEAAHEAGVIHRDLKPANIKVRPDGTVKVLDFGLAKALDPNPTGDPSQSPTLTAAATQMGVIMGTAAYMSPEQAAGRQVDRSADAWAYGVILFEMLAGQRLFTGETISHVLASILKVDPDWTLLPTMPTPLLRLIRRCLEKNSKRRLRDLREAGVALEETEAWEESSVPLPIAGRRGWRVVLPAVLVAGIFGALVAVVILDRDLTTGIGATRLSVLVPEGHEMLWGQCPRLALSPDGRTLAYVAQGQLYARRLDSTEAVALEGTENAEGPFFSPDGQRIGFAQGMLKTIPLDGGPITDIAGTEFGDSCGESSWGEDGTIVYRGSGSRVLWSVAAAGGVPQQLTALEPDSGDSFHMWPQLIDGGREIIYTVLGPSGLWGDSKIVVQDMVSNERTTLVERGTYGRYVDSGHLVFATANGNLLAAPYDSQERRLTGDPVPVESGVRVAGWGGAASFALSDGGTAAFVRGSSTTRQVLWWVDRSGNRIRQIGEPLSTWFINLSTDGRYLALDIQHPTNGDVWLIDTETGGRDRFTFNEAFDYSPVFSPDRDRVAYVSYESDGRVTVYVDQVRARGNAIAVYTADRDRDVWVFSWSPEGDWLGVVETAPGRESHLDIRAIRLDDPEAAISVATTRAREWFPQFSPDGKWLAYTSDEGGRDEVYVVAFPDVGQRHQVSVQGGINPRWSPQGDESFFWAPDNTLMSSNVTTGVEFRWAPPEPLFSMPDFEKSETYEVGGSGDVFLLGLRNEATVPRQIEVAVNWLSELQERVPIP